MKTNLCHMCWGSGNFVVFQNDNRKFFSCPHCNGVGTLVCDGPPTIRIHWKKNKKLDKINRELQSSPNTAFGPLEQWIPPKSL